MMLSSTDYLLHNLNHLYKCEKVLHQLVSLPIMFSIASILKVCVQPGDNRDYSTRQGQDLYFHWIHYTPDNQEIPFELNLQLGIDFDYMQQRYRSCNHNHGRYRENITRDPYSNVV